MTLCRSLCLVAALTAPAATAQIRETLSLEDFRTPDGSYFILVPTGGPPVVHWVMATPAGVLEEPPGMEGLSFAVARSAMVGTSSTSSLDWEAESLVLSQQDRLEQELDRLLALATEVPDTLRQELEEQRTQAAALTDPIAWERRLRRAPALGAQLTELPEANLLQVTTSVEGLTRVALLLIERREGETLRDVHGEFRRVRGELALQRGTDTVARMRREVLGLSFLGHPFARAYAATDQPRPLSRSDALALFRRTHHPRRTLHVLTGGFSIEAVRAQLERIFATTTLPDPGNLIREAPPAPVARVSSIRGTGTPRLAMCFRIPDDASREETDIISSWLTGGLDSEIVTRLREAGHTEAIVRGTAPFPLRSSRLFLLEAEDPTPEVGKRILRGVSEALAQIASGGPSDEELTTAVARTRSAAAAARLGPRNLAREIAIACAIDGKTPAEALAGSNEEVSRNKLVLLVARMLDPKNRTVVRLEVTP